MKIALITGGAPHYELGLISGLLNQDLELEVLGGSELSGNKVFESPKAGFYNLEGGMKRKKSLVGKVLHISGVYWRMMKYAWKSPAKIFHLQWPYKFVLFDRTILAIYYKALGKRIVFTAHNIDGFAHGKRSIANYLSLKFFYWLTDHLIVHTEKSKSELERVYGLSAEKISVIPHGLMTAVPETGLTSAEAKSTLGVEQKEKVILLFGLITPYKGVELLVDALGNLKKAGHRFTLIIAGRIKECQAYWDEVRQQIKEMDLEDKLILQLKHIPDDEVEVYFKGADLLVLPYRNIYQSGVLFLAYRFGLPVVATDVGSLREDIQEGQTGFVSAAEDSKDLARTIQKFFASDLYTSLSERRVMIRKHAQGKYSWDSIGKQTKEVYERIGTERRSRKTAIPDRITAT